MLYRWRHLWRTQKLEDFDEVFGWRSPGEAVAHPGQYSRAFETKAREALGSKVFGKVVRVEVVDVDRYRREVGRIYLGDRFINLEMVRDGFAWRYVRYDKPGGVHRSRERGPGAQRGLWVDPHPIPPWEFRRAKREARRAQ